MVKKGSEEFKISNLLKDIFVILIGILSAGFGLKGFLIPNGFIDGGVTGISLLISHVSVISLSLLIFVLNIPFMIIGWKQIGRSFVTKTILAIIGLSLCLAFVNYPIITSDKLLIAVFGGFFLGAGIGFAVRGGCVIDGTEILALWLSKKFRTTMGNIILAVNLVIFSFAAFLLGIEPALYSLLIYFSASIAVDFITDGIEGYVKVTIISEKSSEIRRHIVKDLKKGVTIYKGKGGSDSARDIEILSSVVTRLEMPTLIRGVEEIDPDAFIIEESLNFVQGGVVKKRRLTH
jgi:uncharacterized membrane-anchored protein YitT (DUF2179 family)